MWFFFFSSRRRHTSCALVSGVQTYALPIFLCTRFRTGRHAGPAARNRKPAARSKSQSIDRRSGLGRRGARRRRLATGIAVHGARAPAGGRADPAFRSEEHTSELQSLMRSSYAVFCLKIKKPFYSQTLTP